MKRVYFALLVLVLLLVSACSQRIGDFTIVSTKNYEASAKYKQVGRFSGEGTVFAFFGAPFGTPNMKDAVDRAIEAGKGVYLVNAVVETITAIFSSGYRVTGDVFALATTADLNDPSVELFSFTTENGKAVLKSPRRSISIQQ
jgi:hypothetical protein